MGGVAPCGGVLAGAVGELGDGGAAGVGGEEVALEEG